MQKIAVYGKGGIGKSVVATSLSACYALGGKRVLHMGCDPKADSAVRLVDGTASIRTVLDVLGDDPSAVASNAILTPGRHGIHALEAGGPPPRLGCGGRGVARAIEFLDEMGLMEGDAYDVAVFDVLGDVVCGGFAAPLRDRFADKVIIVVSEEPMALFAANNIAKAIHTYHRNGASLAGLVANLRSRDADVGGIERFAARLNTHVVATVERDPRIQQAERRRLTIVEDCPDCPAARALTDLAARLLEMDKGQLPLPTPLTEDGFFDFIRSVE
jgi:nitrogenase iron protein NifH